MKKEEKNKIIGSLVFLHSVPSGWSMGRFRLDDGSDEFSVTGSALTGLSKKETYEIKGVWGQYKGEKQLKVTDVMPYVKATRISISKYLASQYRGIGRTIANKLIDEWEINDGTLDELSRLAVYEPQNLEEWASKNKKFKGKPFIRELKVGVLQEEDSVRRIIKAKLFNINRESDSVNSSVVNNLARFLLGLPRDIALTSEDMPEFTVDEAISSFEKDPFAPMFVIEGYSFDQASKIWLSIGNSKLDKKYVSALSWNIIKKQCESEGHTFLTKNRLASILRSNDGLEIEFVISAIKESGAPIVIDNDKFYVKELYNAESSLSNILKGFLTKSNPILNKTNDEILKSIHTLEMSRGMNLDTEQKNALIGIATSECRMHTITAMPGCGKTAIMEFLAQLVYRDENDHTMLFMAPTGKASKVLNERVKGLSLEAKTVYATIGWGNPNGYADIEDSIIVVDESSMMDLELTNTLLSKIRENAHVIFIGDEDQLASIGPGNILKDLLELPFDHHKLKTVHRNSGDILTLVSSIKNGEYSKFHGGEIMTYGLPNPNKDMERVLNAYVKSCNENPEGAKRVGMLTGLVKGSVSVPGWNITYLNRALQEKMNPNGKKIEGYNLRLGDRIIVKKNQRLECIKKTEGGLSIKSQEYIANGDTGLLKSVVKGQGGENKGVVIDFDDGRTLVLPMNVMDKTSLGFALSIHSAQGTEFSNVMMFVDNGYHGLFNRKLLYTGVSRAKERLTLFANGSTIKEMINRPGVKRNSFLTQRVNGSNLNLECNDGQEETKKKVVTDVKKRPTF